MTSHENRVDENYCLCFQTQQLSTHTKRKKNVQIIKYEIFIYTGFAIILSHDTDLDGQKEWLSVHDSDLDANLCIRP